jgi:hypothetical protein
VEREERTRVKGGSSYEGTMLEGYCVACEEGEQMRKIGSEEDASI